MSQTRPVKNCSSSKVFTASASVQVSAARASWLTASASSFESSPSSSVSKAATMSAFTSGSANSIISAVLSGGVGGGSSSPWSSPSSPSSSPSSSLWSSPSSSVPVGSSVCGFTGVSSPPSQQGRKKSTLRRIRSRTNMRDNTFIIL